MQTTVHECLDVLEAIQTVAMQTVKMQRKLKAHFNKSRPWDKYPSITVWGRPPRRVVGTEERADRTAVSQAESRLRRAHFPGGVGPLHPVGEEAGLPHHGQSWANPPAAASCSPERGFTQERRGDSGL